MIRDGFHVVAEGSREKRVMQTHPHVRLIQHSVNQGFGAAVLIGFTQAAKDRIFCTDADRQFVLGELARAKRSRHRFVELPVSHRPRVAGNQTGATLHVIVPACRELARFHFQFWREGKLSSNGQ